jgi:hypothetical protein
MGPLILAASLPVSGEQPGIPQHATRTEAARTVARNKERIDCLLEKSLSNESVETEAARWGVQLLAGQTQLADPGAQQLAFELERLDRVARAVVDLYDLEHGQASRASILHDQHAKPELHERCQRDASESYLSQVPANE